MKRSQVNAALSWAKALLEEHNLRLPETAYWSFEEWSRRSDDIDTIREVMLGWDITDFGMGDFDSVGGVLYTVRNGSVRRPEVGVPYCEKYILMKEGQRLPKHFHKWKTEDIINRAGGTLHVYLWNTDEEGRQLDTDVRVFTDGLERVVKAGEAVPVTKGNSITLCPGVAHIFGPAPGTGDIVVGEVSKVNDDNNDNFFLENTSRFAEIEEDVPAMHPLCNEYDKIGRRQE